MYDESDVEIHPRLRSTSEDQLTAAPFAELFSEAGIEIKPVEEQVVVLVPHHWRRQQALMSSLAVSPDDHEGQKLKTTKLFESSEHVIIAENTVLYFEHARQVSALSYLFTLENGLQLTYGQILALAGDFFGDPACPITGMGPEQPNQGQLEEQFQANFNSLAVHPASVAEVQRILVILQEEFAKVAEVIALNEKPSAAYDQLGDSLSLKWNNATRQHPTSIRPLLWIPFGRYLKLAQTNWDHFRKDALLCYDAGHQLAMKAASVAETDEELAQAYAINAFADHFLTDLFSAGHIRTPRRALYDDQMVGPGLKNLASLLARSMHDEDCRNGLWVTNERGDEWVAYGDKRYRDIANYQNAHIVTLAVQQSVEEVFDAYVDRKVPSSYESEVFGFIPLLYANWEDKKNYSPLFVHPLDTQSPDVKRRKELSNLCNYYWIPHKGVLGWYTYATYLKLKVMGWIKGPPLAPTGPGSTASTGGSPGATGETGAPPGGQGVAMTGPDFVGLKKPTKPIGAGGPTGYKGGQ